ncbi:hypothetical protein D9V37_15170 [Nocardioides mangrovicus]|uniref:Uncharacterized protein n=1 Tax=Nocardioides mangrovicus TaxID=2478913 RepID=A0A3L8NYT1_9ACTN|nr:hypothetical protein [Nocardioides mangrovicus]RLV47519.1 hypothetical protein D9V37_15170 [Nocardioides mangrovicus]
MGAPPGIEEFAAYAMCGDTVVLSVSADAAADVVAAAEVVAGWYGFGLRVCRAERPASARPDSGSHPSAA